MKKKILNTVLGIAIIAPAPLAVVATATSCGEHAQADIPEDVHVTTESSQIDPELGCATFGVMLPEQPKDNKVLVTIAKKAQQPDVRLVEAWDNLGIGVSSYEYSVENTFFSFNVGFKDFFGVDANSYFDISLEYASNNGSRQLRELKDLEIFVEYGQRPAEEEMHILDFNDFHGAAPGFGDDVISGVNRKNPGIIRVAKKMGDTLQKFPGSIVLSAGDNATGDSFSTAMHGESIFPIEKALGVRYSAVGNHEFDWGNDQLSGEVYDRWARSDKTNGKYFVSSNILQTPLYKDYTWELDPSKLQFETDYNIWNNNRVRWTDPYKLVNMDGHLVCLIGLTTRSTYDDGNQDIVRSYSFIDYNAAVCYSAYLCRQELGDEWFHKIDSFLLLTHLECDQKIDKETGARGPVTGPAADLATEIDFNWVDGIIAGHSHKDVYGTVKNHWGKDVWVAQGANSGQQYVDTTLVFDNTKPVGQRLKSISMKSEHVPIDGEELKDEDLALQRAQEELKQIRAERTSNPTLNTVIDAYDNSRNAVADVLDHEIAQTEYGCNYMIYDSGEKIGHVYFRPTYKDDLGTEHDMYDDELGAWANLAQIIGFSSYFQDEIEGITSNLKFPSISFINFDSLGGEIPGPTEQGTKSKVTLKDLFTIQGYENTICLGYLSVWQLADIINYLLAGNNTVFNYEANNDYFNPNSGSLIDRSDLTTVADAKEIIDGNVTEIECIDNFKPTDYKGSEHYCNYLPGPLQWYGFRFDVEKTPDGDEDKSIGRDYRLKFEAPATDSPLYGVYTAIPKIWIYHPGETFDPTGLYDPFAAPEEGEPWEDGMWIPAEEYLINEEYIPCIVNSFTFNGGNVQATMFKQYFEFNALMHPKQYNIHQKTEITRDLMIRFCELTKGLSKISFDLPKDTHISLVGGYGH